MKATKGTNGKRHIITVEVSRDLKERLKRLAKRQDRNVSYLIRSKLLEMTRQGAEANG